MTNGEMQQALILAFELLCHAAPDPDLDDGTWTERCDKWLDTYPPSKVGLTVQPEAARCPNCGLEHQNLPNHYCPDCSARFNRLGLWPYVDAKGPRNTDPTTDAP